MALTHLSGALSAMQSGSHTSGMLAFLQTPDAIDSGHAKLLTLFVGITAVAFLVIAIVAVVLAVVIYQVQKRLLKIVEEVKVKAMPIVDKTNGIVGDLRPKINEIAEKTNGIIGDLRPRINTVVDDLTPKIKSVTDDINHISGVVRGKVDEFQSTLDAANQTVKDANAKTHAQINRVDGMISSALTATAALGTSIHDGVRVPIREATRGVNAIRDKINEAIKKTQSLRESFMAGRSTARKSNPPTRITRVPQRVPFTPSGTAGPEIVSGPRDGEIETL